MFNTRSFDLIIGWFLQLKHFSTARWHEFFSKISITPLLNLSNWEWYKLGGIKFSQKDYYKIKGFTTKQMPAPSTEIAWNRMIVLYLKEPLMVPCSNVNLKLNSSKQKF